MSLSNADAARLARERVREEYEISPEGLAEMSAEEHARYEELVAEISDHAARVAVLKRIEQRDGEDVAQEAARKTAHASVVEHAAGALATLDELVLEIEGKANVPELSALAKMLRADLSEIRDYVSEAAR